MRPEEKARKNIDRLLEAAGWNVQDYEGMNLGASLGVAIRHFRMMNRDEADYLLFVDRKACGVIEAKSEGTTLRGVDSQSDKYLKGLPNNIPHVQMPLPFAYESTGIETLFRNVKDPEPRSRRLFAFHRPETLKEWALEKNTLRARLKQMPPLVTEGLRDCQIKAITNLEKSFTEARPRALIQMATGSGKTYAAVTFVYRLIKYAKAKRILFLVDRNNLGRQAFGEFYNYRTSDDRRRFSELYNIQRLTSNTIDPVSCVCISTIQRIYSMLREEELEPELEETSIFEIAPPEAEPREVIYNPQIPIEYFDFIITDECHRSIYNLWRQVLEYFDAFIIGLTATPSKQTLGFFNQNLVTEYGHERAVADGVAVGYDVYRIVTEITKKGSIIPAKYYIDKRDKLTRKIRWELLDEPLEYSAKQLDRDVVAKDQIRTVIKTFKEKLTAEIFPGRTEVPKTLVFTKGDSHAEDVVDIIREEFGKGNEFCKKITYKTTGEKTEDLISSFRNSFNPRIAVSVDMISTGTNIKPLECLLFMRDVKSRVYFEQMKGRGTRTISSTDLRAVTPDARHKTRFVVVDAVGVTESDKTDSRPLERKRSTPFDKLVESVALGVRDIDTITSLAGRLARLDRAISDNERTEIKEAAGGKPLRQLINKLMDVIDPDIRYETAKEMFQTETPSKKQLKNMYEKLAAEACAPFDDPNLRNTIIDIKQRSEQVIDTISIDQVLYAGADPQALEKAKNIVNSFKEFIDENKDELTALQIIYGEPYTKRHLTYNAIKELAKTIKKPPRNLTPELLWRAYEKLDKSKVRGAGPQKLLTNTVSLVRFAIGKNDILEPFSESVNRKFNQWLSQQEQQRRKFTPEQLEWLEMIKDHIATSLSIELDDFDNVPFNQKGGAIKAYQIFRTDLNTILEEMNLVLVE